MNVIFYANQSSAERGRLQRVIDIVVSRECKETCTTIESLEKRLHQPINEPTVIVLLVSHKQELRQFFELRDWLFDRKLILILPDDDQETISQSHALRPRFITYSDGDFIDVSAVLGKMLTRAFNRDNEYLLKQGVQTSWPY